VTSCAFEPEKVHKQMPEKPRLIVFCFVATALGVFALAGCASDASDPNRALSAAGASGAPGAGGASARSVGAGSSGSEGLGVPDGTSGSSVGGAGASGGGSSGGGSSPGGVSGGSGTAGGSSGGGGAAAIDHNAVGAIVVLGSSTAAGTGPTDPKNAWVERYRAYLMTEFPKFVLTNLAVGGYATADIQPSDYQNPGKAGHNITAALNLKPDAIIINMPTNDTEYGVSANAQMVNFARVTDLATKSGVPCWVTTSQPRDFKGESAQDVTTKHQTLMAVRDAITAKYTDHSLDFWTPFANADGSIKTEFERTDLAQPDGIHMNDAAHAIMAMTVIAAKIPEAIITKR
jgi:lysophospholipase L1-like esterase